MMTNNYKHVIKNFCIILYWISVCVVVGLLCGCNIKPEDPKSVEGVVYVDRLANNTRRYVDCVTGNITIYDSVSEKVISSTTNIAHKDQRCIKNK